MGTVFTANERKGFHMVGAKLKITLSGALALMVAMILIVAGVSAAPKDAYAAQQGANALITGTAELETQASEVTSGDWIYVAQSATTAKLVHYTGISTAVTVPAAIDGKTVVAIGPELLAEYYSEDEWVEPAKVKSISIPKTVKSIGEKQGRNDFSDTGVRIKHAKLQNYQIGGEYLQAISVAKDNPSFKSIKGVLFNKKGTKLCLYPSARKASKYTVPKTVKTIANSAFEFAAINTVVISKSVRKIEPFAFAYSSVKKVSFKPGIKTIGNYAFYSAENLKNISFPKSLRKIGKAAFAYTGRLGSLKFNDGLKEIGVQAFYWCQVPKKRTITIPKSVTKIYGAAFYMVDYSGNGKVTFRVSKATKLKKSLGFGAIESELGDGVIKVVHY